MATNSSRGNPIAAGDDAPPAATTDAVPPVGEETKAEVTETAGAVHQGGEDASAPLAEDQTVPEEAEGETEEEQEQEQEQEPSK